MKHGFLQLFHLFDLALLFDSSFFRFGKKARGSRSAASVRILRAAVTCS